MIKVGIDGSLEPANNKIAKKICEENKISIYNRYGIITN